MRTLDTFSTVIRRRLLLLIEVRGFTPTQVARKLGRPHSWLMRRLEDDPEKRQDQLTTDQVDEILAALPATYEALCAPVLSQTDRTVLRWLRESGGADPVPVETLSGIFADARSSVRRLVAQGFVLQLEPESGTAVVLTDLDRR